jgi:hypothetical protein
VLGGPRHPEARPAELWISLALAGRGTNFAYKMLDLE